VCADVLMLVGFGAWAVLAVEGAVAAASAAAAASLRRATKARV